MKNKSKIYLGDSQDILPTFKPESVDLMATDPPYGVGFMGKDCDRAVPPVTLWKECYRVLKPGAFAFVMSIPRQDCLAHMIVNLGDAGFDVSFSSIYWTYASGYPKAQNLSKAADKRAGVEREVIGRGKSGIGTAIKNGEWSGLPAEEFDITIPKTDEAKALEGAYAGFQPKPAVETIIVAMKPINEKTYLDQALKNKHGCTWLDNCKIPYENESDSTLRPNGKSSYERGGGIVTFGKEGTRELKSEYSGGDEKGRFPANLVCEDDVLNNGAVTKSQGGTGVRSQTEIFEGIEGHNHFNYGDSGSFSRYFSLDAWFKDRIKLLPKEVQETFPWLIVPKASKSEKNRWLKGMPDKVKGYGGKERGMNANDYRPDGSKRQAVVTKNTHATVKPIKLMTWLITLGSRESDIVLDPFLGSGTTYIAATALGRYCKGIEREKEHYGTAIKRCNLSQKSMSAYF